MNFSRRSFLGASAAGLVSVSSTPAFGKLYARETMGGSNLGFAKGPHRLPIMQGRTDKSSTVLIIQHSIDEKYQFSLSENSSSHLKTKNSLKPKFRIEEVNIPGTRFALTHIHINQLSLGRTYSLVVTSESEQIDIRTFQALDTDKKKPKIVMASCMSDHVMFEKIAMQAWANVADQQPDILLLTGDTSYADQRTFALLRNDLSLVSRATRYFETRSRLSLFRMPELIPTLAIWDDHDFGPNDSDGRFTGKSDSLHLFKMFWGDSENSVIRNFKNTEGGVGFKLSAFGQNFYFMDCRFFHYPGQSYWGQDQKDWLLHGLDRSPKPSWIIQGTQFFGGFQKKDSFETHQKAELLDLMRSFSQSNSPVCFAGGDVHFSDIMQIDEELLGYKSYEFTSSSIHSFSHRPKGYSERSLFGQSREGKDNFLIFETEASGTWNIQTQCLRSNGEKSFSHQAVISRDAKHLVA